MEIEELMMQEKMKIVGKVESEDTIILFVEEVNPENLKYEGMMIDNKRVHIKKVMPLW